jgi:hypothetical protein
MRRRLAKRSARSQCRSDQSITLPVNAVTLNASASSDADGTIASFAWSKISDLHLTPYANANIINGSK